MNSSFNSLEKYIARLLSRMPFVKQWVKSFYSRVIYLKRKKSYKFQTPYEIHKVGWGAENSFFGYYDKSPVSSDGFLLCHLTSSDTKHIPSTEQCISIVLFGPELETPLWQTSVQSFNWQQGARVHWLDDDLFIFNDFDKSKRRYVARVFSKALLQEIKCFNNPVQDSFGTKYFLSINYRRLMSLRPDYGYCNLSTLNKCELSEMESDGIWLVDFSSGESRLLVSLSDIFAVETKPEFSRALHKVNHVMISPDGKKSMFLHRYYLGKRRFDRLLLADTLSGDLKLIADYDMVSHCFWTNNDTVLGYMRGPNKKDAYWLIDIKTGMFTPVTGKGLEKYGDGHPHVRGDWFVTDTYPDKSRMQHLLLCNWKTGVVREVGEFYHGFEYSGETRCDMHPRYSHDGRRVFFDSVFNGKRHLYFMEISV